MVRVHEIALKGKNRPLFFQRLERNLRLALRGTPVQRVVRRHLGVEVSPVPDSAWPEVAERIGRVFGVVKFYRCRKIPRSLEAIEAALVSLKPKVSNSRPSASRPSVLTKRSR